MKKSCKTRNGPGRTSKLAKGRQKLQNNVNVNKVNDKKAFVKVRNEGLNYKVNKHLPYLDDREFRTKVNESMYNNFPIKSCIPYRFLDLYYYVLYTATNHKSLALMAWSWSEYATELAGLGAHLDRGTDG